MKTVKGSRPGKATRLRIIRRHRRKAPSIGRRRQKSENLWESIT